MNVVMTGDGRFVEVQGTAEGVAFTRVPSSTRCSGSRGRHLRDRRRATGDDRRGSTDRDPDGRIAVPVVLATGNPDKAREIDEIFVTSIGEPLAAWAVTVGPDTFGFVLDRPHDLAARIESLRELRVAPDVEETGSTLEENARIKAQALCDAMDMLAVADDTGLEVDVLGGAPGIYAARYAGRGRNLRGQRRQTLARTRRGLSRAANRSLRDRRPGVLARRPRTRRARRGRRADRRDADAANAASATTRCSSRSRATDGRLRK